VLRRFIGVAFVALFAQAVLARSVAPQAAGDAPASKSFHLDINGEVRYVGAIAVDSNDNIFLAGATYGPLPKVNAEMPRRGSGVNAFVTKFDPNGQVLWTSFVGGAALRPSTLFNPGGSYALDISVDPSGQPVIVGRTNATDFPVVNAFIGAAQATTSDGFVTKLSSDGRRIIFSSYFGSRNGGSALTGVAVGPAGETWVAGVSFGIATQFDVSDPDSNQVIVLKLNPAGGVVWSTRMSGTSVWDMDVDGLGQPHVAAGCSPQPNGPCSPFVEKLSSDGSHVLYRERVTSASSALRMALTATGNAVIAGRDDPAIADPWPAEWGLGGFGFVRLLNPSGARLSSNVVNSVNEGNDVHVAASDRLIVAFNTTAIRLPTERPLFPTHVDGPIYASEDGAATWLNLGGRGAAQTIQIDPERNQIFAGGYRSDDDGRTWVESNTPSTNFAVDPRRPNIHWRAGPEVHRRVDGGAWQRIAPSPATTTSNTVTAIAVSPHDGTAWVGGDFGVDVVSADGRYQLLNEGLPKIRFGNNFERPLEFAFDPVDHGTVYLGTWAGLYRRSAGDAAWSYLTGQIDAWDASYEHVVRALAVDPADPNVLLVGRLDGMYRSADRGRTWQYVMRASQIRTLVFDPNRPGVAYAGGNRIYRSLDHGATWQQTSVGYESRFGPSAMAIHAKTSRLYVSSEQLSPIPFVMKFSGSGATYARSWATYLAEGKVFDLAMTLSGDAVVGTVTYPSYDHAEVTIVRIGQ
jgi:hypothetical protein